MELPALVLWDLEPPDHGDNDGVDGSGDTRRWTGELDFNGDTSR